MFLLRKICQYEAENILDKFCNVKFAAQKIHYRDFLNAKFTFFALYISTNSVNLKRESF